jgi:hypothetical protein
MRRDRRRRPCLEHLDSRVLLSGADPMMMTMSQMPMTTGAMATTTATQAVSLTGTINGTLTSKMSNPDVGHQYRLSASGRVLPLGMAGANGHLQTPGFIANGKSTGTITLTTLRGSITLALTSDPQSGPALQTTFHYQIVKGTGHFKGATGSGDATLTLKAPPATSPGHAGRGTTTHFTMTFTSTP